MIREVDQHKFIIYAIFVLQPMITCRLESKAMIIFRAAKHNTIIISKFLAELQTFPDQL